MFDYAISRTGFHVRASPFGVRWEILLASTVVAAVGLAIVAPSLIWRARDEQRQIEYQAKAVAASTAGAVDREIVAAGHLLKGFSKSPALVSGDLRGFYDQLMASPRPKGSAITLWDRERQILDTQRPFGSSLPKMTDDPDAAASWTQIRDRGLTVSDRKSGMLSGTPAVAVSLRLDDWNGDMTGLVTALLPSALLSSAARSIRLPDGWAAMVLDRQLAPIAIAGTNPPVFSGELPARLKAMLREGRNGEVFAVSDGTSDLLVASQRNATPDFVTIATMPRSIAKASVDSAVDEIVLSAVILAFAGGLIGWVSVRKVSKPIEALRASEAAASSQLKLAEARQASLWGNTPESLFVVSVLPDGRFVFEGLNPAHERATGLKNEDIAGKEPEECLAPEAAAAVTAQYRECIRRGEPMIYDEVLDLPGGRKHWQTSLAPVRDPDSGRIVLLVGTARDVTHDREARLEIDRSRRLLQRIVDASPDMIYVYDAQEGRNVFLGGQVEKVMGHSTEDIRDMGSDLLSRLVHPDDLPAAMAHIAAFHHMPDGASTAIEYRILDRAGRTRWLRSKDTVFSRTATGEVAKVLGTATNIDHVKIAQADLAAANERLSAILASVSDCYFTLDRDYRITNINEAALDWMGGAKDAALGRCFWTLCQPINECGAATKAAMDSRMPVHREVRSGVRPDRWLDYHAYPSDEGVSVFFRDITDNRLAREAEEEARALLQSSLDALSAHVAILDESGQILSVNRAWARFAQEYGGRLDQCGVGASYLEACTQGDAAREGLQSILSGDKESFRTIYPCPALEQVRWFQLRATRFVAGGGMRVVVAHEDITEAMAAKAAVNQLSGRLLELQEEERQRIAEELHDSTAQHLVAIGLNLMRLQKFVKLSDGKKLLGEIEGSLQEATKEVRTFTYLLHPPRLEDDGLSATLKEFAGGYSRRTGLAAIVRVSAEVDDLPFELQRSLLRIVQEALTNAHRHAQASQVAIDLSIRSGTLRLRVADDGSGLVPGVRPSASHGAGLGVGISGMRARLRQFGGELTFLSGRRGTIVVARVPGMGDPGRHAADAAMDDTAFV